MLQAGLIGPWAARVEPGRTRPGRTEMSNEKVRAAGRVTPGDGEEHVSIVEPDPAPTEAERERRRRPTTRERG